MTAGARPWGSEGFEIEELILAQHIASKCIMIGSAGGFLFSLVSAARGRPMNLAVNSVRGFGIGAVSGTALGAGFHLSLPETGLEDRSYRLKHNADQVLQFRLHCAAVVVGASLGTIKWVSRNLPDILGDRSIAYLVSPEGLRAALPAARPIVSGASLATVAFSAVWLLHEAKEKLSK